MPQNPFTGNWLRNSLKMKFPHKKDLELAKMIGISPQAFANWGRNDGIARLPNAETLYLGYKALGMLADTSAAPPGSPSFIRSGEWPVRGLASTDDPASTRTPGEEDSGEFVTAPPSMALVPVQGNSMAPIISSGQYVMIDRDREGFEANGGIVVASIVDSDWERREKMPGTFVKRCFRGDGFYYFTSVDSTYSPFSSWQDHCRIWPVLGIWLGKHAMMPEHR